MPQQDGGRERSPIVDRSTLIRDLNDVFRHTFDGGIVMRTHGFVSLSHRLQRAFIAAIQAFDGFTDGNDPYREHDFGLVAIEDIQVFWKIDYYDETLTRASPDPADRNLTTRVLTIMLANDY